MPKLKLEKSPLSASGLLFLYDLLCCGVDTLHAIMKSSLWVLSLLCFCLASSAAAAQGTLRYQANDGDTQQVNPEEIWRSRATSTSDEPPGAVVIDYGFERVYVKDSLASVAEKVGRIQPLKK